ncbi:MAG: 50S ribosomal protein L25 [Candidatus Latescibacteria bacterium]|nr:50S ribosomal protein L25 [Candidatus Latescibacterota bacterium]
MEKTILRARRREATGTRAARRIRRNKSIPAVLYGVHEDPQPIQIDVLEFQALVKQGLTENTLITLLLDDEKKSDRITLIREVQRDPVRNELRHLDFVHIDLTEGIRVDVPLHLTGQAEGVKRGGILEQRLYAIEIECLPTEIPEKFTIDVTDLDIGDSYHLSDVVLGSYKVHTNIERTVVQVAAPRVIEEVVEEVVALEMEEPELVGEREVEEEAREAAAEGGAGDEG